MNRGLPNHIRGSDAFIISVFPANYKKKRPSPDYKKAAQSAA